MATFKERAELNMALLGINPNLGNGIILGVDQTRRKFIQVYWMMGLDEASKNQKLELGLLGDQVRVVATEPKNSQIPSPIIYTAMESSRGFHFVSNGKQTDDLARGARVYPREHYVDAGELFRETLVGQTFKPDAPNFTPSISGMIFDGIGRTTNRTMLSKIYCEDPARPDISPARAFYSYPGTSATGSFAPGEGRCLHTYSDGGSPLLTFNMDPYPVLLEGSVVDIANTYWKLLNASKRVALVVKSIDMCGDPDKPANMGFKIINQAD